MSLFTEKYRPRTIDECILPDNLKDTLKNFVKEGNFPHLLMAGNPGVGKTTVAKALCSELGFDNILVNSSDERGIDTLRSKINQFASTKSLGGGKKVIILDEADYITPDAQAALRGSMEQFSENCTFILTCNYTYKLIEAIHSRCSVLEFTFSKEETPKLAMEFWTRCRKILDDNSIIYDKKVLSVIVGMYFPDFRRTLNELQRVTVEGSPIDLGTLSKLKKSSDVSELIRFLKEKNFRKMREWVAENSGNSLSVFRQLYKELPDHVTDISFASAVMVLAKYQYQAAFVADQELNMVACMTELMVEMEFV